MFKSRKGLGGKQSSKGGAAAKRGSASRKLVTGGGSITGHWQRLSGRSEKLGGSRKRAVGRPGTGRSLQVSAIEFAVEVRADRGFGHLCKHACACHDFPSMRHSNDDISDDHLSVKVV
eukprot:4132832-Prymnesium_polylepis.1